MTDRLWKVLIITLTIIFRFYLNGFFCTASSNFSTRRSSLWTGSVRRMLSSSITGSLGCLLSFRYISHILGAATESFLSSPPAKDKEHSTPTTDPCVFVIMIDLAFHRRHHLSNPTKGFHGLDGLTAQ